MAAIDLALGLVNASLPRRLDAVALRAEIAGGRLTPAMRLLVEEGGTFFGRLVGEGVFAYRDIARFIDMGARVDAETEEFVRRMAAIELAEAAQGGGRAA
ncbi:MAG: hypothetical protein FJX47_02360 [Alphaproteobacteria bacterium]|nr:hypothetical protein [Alphaproteobacteria bacterium]